MSVEEILNCDPASLIGVVIVAILGSWLSYKFGRHNKRIDEFNALRDLIAPKIKTEVENPDPMYNPLTEDDFDILLSLMYPWQKQGFSESFIAYKTAQGGETKTGEWPGLMAYRDPKHVSAAAAKVLTYLKRR